MKIREIMTTAVESIGPGATLRDAAERMCTLDTGILPVVADGRLAGVVTDRDITVRGVAEGRDPSTTKVSEVMTSEVVSCFEDEEVEAAARQMARNQVRRLVIVDRGQRLAGILSLGDLAVDTGDKKLAGKVLERVSQPGLRHE